EYYAKYTLIVFFFKRLFLFIEKFPKQHKVILNLLERYAFSPIVINDPCALMHSQLVGSLLSECAGRNMFNSHPQLLFQLKLYLDGKLEIKGNHQNEKEKHIAALEELTHKLLGMDAEYYKYIATNCLWNFKEAPPKVKATLLLKILDTFTDKCSFTK